MDTQQKISRKQLLVLFLCSMFIMMFAGPLLRLLPVYASQLGASSSLVGLYMAMVQAGLVAGTLIAGWLSDRFQHRQLTIIVAGIVTSLSLAMMGWSGTLWQLTIATSATWFFGGIAFTTVMILSGILAGEDERGKVYGLLIVSMPLANFLAAPVAGRTADGMGYPVLLVGYAVFALSIPITALFLEDRTVHAQQSKSSADVHRRIQRSQWISLGLYFLVTATFIMAFVGFVNQLGLSLSMYAQNYSSSNIANAVAFAALVSIPLIYLFGWLSDRVPRYRILIACYLVAGIGTLVLAVATAVWQFWLAAVLVAVLTASDSLSNALTNDLVSKERVGRAMSLTNSARWMGAVVGSATTGFAIDLFGVQNSLLFIFLLVPIAILLVARINRAQEQSPVHVGL